MAKLFVIATPLSLLVAQQIVRQEQMNDAVLLESYVGSHKDFLQIYDLCRIDSLWVKRLPPIGGFPGWDNSGTKLLKTAHRTWRRYQRIKKLLEDNNIDEIFLANYQEETYRFMTVLFSNQGYKVSFYEEGSSNYVQLPYHINTGIVAKLKEVILDSIYYVPLYHIRFAFWRNNPNRPSHGLPIYRRLSIIPGILNERYDVVLHCEPMLSERLRQYIDRFIESDNSLPQVLLLTEPMKEVLGDSLDAYYNVIVDNLKTLKKDTIVSIKFHPRDPDLSRAKIVDIVKQLGLKYTILSAKINIPVEYFLLYMNFDRILFFNASTYLYNGYLFPKRNFQCMLRDLYIKSKEMHASAYSLTVIKGWCLRMNLNI